MVVAVVLCVLSPSVSGEGRNDTVTKTADFDKESNCYDSTSVTMDGENVSVDFITKSSYGALVMDRFDAADITFYVNVNSDYQQSRFYVTIDDHDVDNNFIRIEFYAYSGGTDVTVKDTTPSGTEETEFGTTIDVRGVWSCIDITLKAMQRTGANRPSLSMTIDHEKICTNHLLQVDMIEGRLIERTFTTAAWTRDVRSQIWVDKIEVDTMAGGAFNTLWIFVAVVTGATVFTVVARHYQLWPLKRRGRKKRSIG